MSQPSRGALYAALLAYPEPGRIPYEALAQRFGVSVNKLKGLTGALVRGTPKALTSLQEAGYTMEELPSWVGSKAKEAQKPSPEPRSEPMPEPKPDPAGELREQRMQVQGSPKNGVTGDAPLGSGLGSGLGSEPRSEPRSEPPSSSMDAALQLMNQKEGSSTVEFEGRRYHVQNVGGEFKLTPVTQTEVLANPALAAAMGKAMMESMEVNMLAVAKKVALSPVVVIGHGMVLQMRHPETGEPLFVGDIGDFINWCCSFALRNAFGIRIGVMTGAPSLMSAMTPRSQPVEMKNIV